MADSHDENVPMGPARSPGVIANVLAIIGFIILIIIVIWGILHIVSLSTGWFSGSSSSKHSITVTVPSQAPAQQPFSVAWKYSSNTKGTYAVLYQCVKGLKMSVDGNAIPCGAAYTLGNATGTASMIPTLSGTSSVQTEITVLYIPSAAGTTGPEATGSAKTTIYAGAPTTQNPQPAQNNQNDNQNNTQNTQNTGSQNNTQNTNGNSSNSQNTGSQNTGTQNNGSYQPKPAPQPAPKPTYVPKPATPADLSVRIIAVGVIDPYTGAFVARAPVSPSEVSAVQFDIANRGGTTAGSYVFQAQIPTTQPYTFTSQPQAPLAPGAHVINTLRFTPAVDGTFSVSVDVYNSVRESNESNNYASHWVTGAYNYGGYPQYPSVY